MKEQLIKINENNLVSARELHEFLEVKSRFNDWINNRISKYGFEDNSDYTKILVQCVRGQNEYDYALTLEMAKELSMVENNEKGRQARRYFIECEKKIKEFKASYMIDDPIKRAEAWIEEQKEKMRLEKQIEEDKPKVLFADAVSTSQTTILIGELAKLLKQNGIETGQKRLFEWLRNNGYLIKRKGSDYNLPTQKSMEMGLFLVKENAITHSDGSVRITKTTKVTGKGQQYFVNKFLGKA